MITSTLDKLGVTVSRLGFGLMRLPLQEDKKIDRAAAGKMIDRAMAAGINYYDTAYSYHSGESQRFAKEALVGKYPRDSFMLATKLPTWLVKTAEDVERLFNEQLESCGVEYFDVYHIHALEKTRWATIKEIKGYDILKKKKDEGKIKNLGFSYHGDYDTFAEIVDSCEWDFVQIQINYLDYTMTDAKRYYDKLNERGVACIVMEPVRGGFLANLPDNAAAPLRAVNNDSDAKWALRWCIDKANMPIILSGMSSMEQLEENLATFNSGAPLTAAEAEALDKASEAIQSVKTVPCTACNYCMPCPFGVKIPDVFRAYNHYKQFENRPRLMDAYAGIGADHTPAVCTKCGVCVSKCPQGIQIPDRLEEAHTVISALL